MQVRSLILVTLGLLVSAIVLLLFAQQGVEGIDGPTGLAMGFLVLAAGTLFTVINSLKKDLAETRENVSSEFTYLKSLMDTTTDHIYFKNLKSRFIMISKAHATHLKLSDPYLAVGKTDFDFFSEEHARQAFEAEQEIIRTGIPLVGIEEKETWTNQEDTWVSTTKLPLHDQWGKIIGTLGTSRDITERKRAQLDLAESDALRELLLDIITHDLKNPASVIYSLAELALAESANCELITGIYASSERLLRVLENTTLLSQATFGEKIPNEELNLYAVLHEVVQDLDSSLHLAEMTLELNVPEDIRIRANPLIAEVFKNYISNAIKYAAAGKQILIDAKQEDDSIVVCVRDFGTTIPEQERERVFERSVQLEDAAKHGRGLGLAIVKRIAKAHSGRAWVEPNLPQGNCFCLRIPHSL